MMRNDSASIFSSLQMDYGDSDEENNIVKDPISLEENEITEGDNEEDRNEQGLSTTELISDDDVDDGYSVHHRHHKTDYIEDITSKTEITGNSLQTDSPSSQNSIKPSRKATRLVSYGPDVDESSTSSEEEPDHLQEPTESTSQELNSKDASILSRSVQNMSNEDIKIPPEPPGQCSAQLQKKIEDMFEKMKKQELDLNRAIQNKKNFRNPSIYEKLIDYCHIDEKGTNFPPEIYDPHIWGKESFYDELDKAQRRDIEKREKEKKTKIEFISGTKKPVSAENSLGPPDEKKRKTKWDAQPANIIHVTKIPSTSQNPGVVSLTAMATGTKATVIPAHGTLSKKSSSLK